MRALGKLTLEELEQLAERVKAAADVLRCSIALLGQAQTQGASVPSPLRADVAPNGHPGVLPSFGPHEELPELRARRQEREEFLARIRNSPERLSKLEQFKHDAPEGEEDAV